MELVAWLRFVHLDAVHPDCLHKECYLEMKTLVKDRKIEWVIGEFGTVSQQNM